MKILLDAGHGSDTAGKRSPVWKDGKQLFEYEFNRAVAGKILAALQRMGVDCSLIVSEQTDVPLGERVRRVNVIAATHGKANCLLVSVHANAGGGTGWEAWTSVGQTASDTYAEFFYDAARRLLPKEFPIRTDLSDGDSDKEAEFTILKNTVCPAVLTENLFMDTEKDCRYIMSEEGREVIAKLHVEAILRCIDYWNKNTAK